MEAAMRASRFLPRFKEHDDWRKSQIALAYDAWAPVEDAGEDAGKVPPERDKKPFKSKWLDQLEELPISPDYWHAYKRWKDSLDGPGCRCQEIKLASRLLIGHGNASATEVGLSVHHTWGVPVIPGSALKGLCAHYTAATYGWQDAQGGADRRNERALFSGPGWDKNRRRVEVAPGDYYRALFGAPDGPGVASSAGLVVFHDALYVPDSSSTTGTDDKPFAVDVLTVHQRSYYEQDKEGEAPSKQWPSDYDSPNPVGFISVRPGAKFLLAVDDNAGWAGLAIELLIEALQEWGAGGKTSAGYGYFR
jgi:CRISPR-associated protein Cmr6